MTKLEQAREEYIKIGIKKTLILKEWDQIGKTLMQSREEMKKTWYRRNQDRDKYTQARDKYNQAKDKEKWEELRSIYVQAEDKYTQASDKVDKDKEKWEELQSIYVQAADKYKRAMNKLIKLEINHILTSKKNINE